MWPESQEKAQPLRCGWTTGSCATACVTAAATRLLNRQVLTVVNISLPKGKNADFNIVHHALSEKVHRCSTIKDAGDDPDITHGARIIVDLELIPQPTVVFKAGPGVGVVSKPGLPLAIGEPAINPVPRRMITEHLHAIAQKTDYTGGFTVTIAIENGEQLALKTMNPRLGIIGGLSILGTTGIVRPFSCGAYIASIYQGVDVAFANGFRHLGASTGNISEQTLKNQIPFEDTALIEMGDFIGALFKQIKKYPIEKLSLCGGVGKMSKLADGHLDLHSSRSQINFQQLAQMAAKLGASSKLLTAIEQANTTAQVIECCQQQGIDICAEIAKKALQTCQDELGRRISLELWLVDRKGEILAYVN